MGDNLIQSKTYSFAVRIVKLYKILSSEQREFILSKQLLRSGTSIGANVEEGIAAQSRKDFISKFSVALKEAKATHYWLRLLKDCDYLNDKSFNSIIADCNEIIVVLTKILKTTRENDKANKI
jgi:four helix bundle protein